MTLFVVPRPDADARRTLADADEALDDTVPDATLAGPFDEGELEDTQPAATPDFPPDFWDAPTVPDLRLRAATGVGDSDWERVLHAVSEAVRRVLRERPR